MSRVGRLLKRSRGLGVWGSIRWSLIRWMDHRKLFSGKTVTIRPLCLQYPVVVRMQSSSDADVFENIFVDEELGFDLKEMPRSVLDLGANVGYASAWFLSKYPECTLVAVEPD